MQDRPRRGARSDYINWMNNQSEHFDDNNDDTDNFSYLFKCERRILFLGYEVRRMCPATRLGLDNKSKKRCEFYIVLMMYLIPNKKTQS